MRKAWLAIILAVLPIQGWAQTMDAPTFNIMAAYCFGVARAKLDMLVQNQCTSATPKFSRWTCAPNRRGQELQRSSIERLRGYLLSLPDPLPLSQLYAIKRGEADVGAITSNPDKQSFDDDLKRIFRCTAILAQIP